MVGLTVEGTSHSLIWVAAGLSAMGVIWRMALRPIVKALQKIASKIERVDDLADIASVLTALPARMDRLEAAVGTVERRTRTLQPNGGESVYDKVTEIKEKLT
jgi:hypothetical protein